MKEPLIARTTSMLSRISNRPQNAILTPRNFSSTNSLNGSIPTLRTFQTHPSNFQQPHSTANLDLSIHQKRFNSTSSLSSKNCIPCEGGVKPLDSNRVQELKKQLHQDWKVSVDNTKISREYHMKDFNSGLQFFQDVGKIAEEEGHHPDLHLANYSNLMIELWTHSIGGLSENDFIVAAKIDQLKPEVKSFPPIK